ncbi:ABC transporter substrate-binding protein [Streptomyces sp. NPDC006385]|uniref:ABC transporter substrate-binding protein n=1 Tax=Streptomyces sp. NPDC006385 TaxID=3156761 RepID=UPI00339F58CC
MESPHQPHPGSRPFSRRGLLKGGAFIGSALAVPSLLTTGCSAAAGGKNSLTFTSDGGAYQDAMTKAWLTPFQKESGITVLQDSPKDYAKVKAMVQSKNVTWDVMTAGNVFGLSNADMALLEPLTKEDIPQIADINPNFVQSHRVGHEVYANVLAYRTDAFGGKVPESWKDFFDVRKFPGKRGLPQASDEGIFEYALLADGVDPEHLYPLDFERALAKLDSIKDHIVWWTTGAQSAQLIADKEVALCVMWNGRVYDLQQSKTPVEIQWNHHFAQADYLTIPKGAANVAACKKLISYILDKKNNARLTDYLPYGPTNTKATSINKKVADQLPTAHADVAAYFDNTYRSAHAAEIDKKFQDWLQK